MKILLTTTLLTTTAQLTHHITPRIIGGTPTLSTRYPYLVSLQTTLHFCGATIIAPDVVLTAAHCTVVDYDAVTIQIGGYSLDGEEASSGARGEVDVVEATRVYVHPDYDSDANSNDYALVFLERPTVADVQYVRLNDDPSLEMEALTALGWGDTTPEGGYDYSNVLIGVEVEYVENGVCGESSDGVDSYEGMVLEGMMCASAKGKDGCQGDSGGPLIIAGNDASTDIQVGISSWGFGCASPHFPGVYARLSNGYPWIRNRVCRRSVDPPEWFDCWDKKSEARRFANPRRQKKNGGGSERRFP